MSAEEIAADYIATQQAAKLPILIPVLMELTDWSHATAARFVQNAIRQVAASPSSASASVGKMSLRAEKHCQEMGLLPRRELV